MPPSFSNIDSLNLATEKNYLYWRRPGHFDNPRLVRRSVGSAEWSRKMRSKPKIPDPALSSSASMRRRSPRAQVPGRNYGFNKQKLAQIAKHQKRGTPDRHKDGIAAKYGGGVHEGRVQKVNWGKKGPNPMSVKPPPLQYIVPANHAISFDPNPPIEAAMIVHPTAHVEHTAF